MCVCICICAFLCSDCVLSRTGVLGTSLCAAVCVIQMFLWHQRTYTSATHSLQVVHICVYAYICVYACIYIYGCVFASMILFDVLRFLIYFCLCIGVRAHVCVYVCACMCGYVHVHMYVYVYMCVCVYVCIYMYMHTHRGAHMHPYWRILFICTVRSFYYMRVYHRCFFNTSMHVWWRIGSGCFSSLFMVSACCWRVMLCLNSNRDRGFVLYISLFLRVLGWWAGVCLCTRVHTHKLLRYLMWAQV